MSPFDVIVVGAGSAGRAAAEAAREAGARVALAEDGSWTTQCAENGCMPSKALLASAHRAHAARTAADLGVDTDVSVDLPAVMRRVRRLRDDFTTDARNTVLDGITCIEGRASFADPSTVRLDDGTELLGRAFVIATGATPRIPAPLDSIPHHTHESIFELEQPGPVLAIVGAGPVGLELGQAFAHLGVEVHVIDGAEDLQITGLPEVDSAYRRALGGAIHWHFHAEVEQAVDDDGIELTLTDGAVIHPDHVLVAAGFETLLDRIGLERAFDVDDVRELAVCEETRRLGDLPVFVAGDVSGPELLHEARWEGTIAGKNAAGSPIRRPRPVALRMVFTEPQCVVVGDPTQPGWCWGRQELADQGRARTEGQAVGELRVGLDADGRVGTAVLVSRDAEHLGHLIAWAVDASEHVDQLLARVFYHPTREEGLRSALEAARRAWVDAARS